MTIGDVMAVVGGVLAICLALWVLLIGAALLFEVKAQAARRVLENQAGRALGVGVALLVTLGFLAIALFKAPGGFKLLGWALLLSLLATSLLGGSGLALLLGERTGALAPQLSPLGALARGAGMLALAWMFPVLGWFLIGPLAVIIGLGAGAKALRTKAPKVLPQSAPALAAPVFPADELCESRDVIG